MYQPTDLKKGTVCQIDGKPYRVVDQGQAAGQDGQKTDQVIAKKAHRRPGGALQLLQTVPGQVVQDRPARCEIGRAHV